MDDAWVDEDGLCKHLLEPATCTLCNGRVKKDRQMEAWELSDWEPPHG